MEAFFGGILRYTLASVLIFATVYQSGKQKCIFVPSVEREFFCLKLVNSFFILSEAVRFTERPSNPTILVEGINNTDQVLVWEFDKEGDVIQQVQFQRNKPGVVTPDTIASRLDSSSFTVFDPFKTDYEATLNNRLTLNRVTNNQEYLYTIVITYVRNSIPQPSLRDEVQIIVKGTNLLLVLVFYKIEVTIASV